MNFAAGVLVGSVLGAGWMAYLVGRTGLCGWDDTNEADE